MSASMTYALLVLFIGLAVIGLALIRAVNRMRRQDLSEMENNFALAMERLGEERHRSAIRAALMSAWVQRLATGKILHLTADGRAAQIVGRKIKAIDNGVCWSYPLRQDVYKWCRSSLAGEFEMIPFFNDDERVAAMWFANDFDALAFKMRWY